MTLEAVQVAALVVEPVGVDRTSELRSERSTELALWLDVEPLVLAFAVESPSGEDPSP